MRAQADTIEELQVQGLSRMSQEALLYAFAVKVGDPYDERRIRQQFKHLWSLGVFEDLTIEAETGPHGGKVLVLKVRERPVLTAVTFDQVKDLTQTQIEDRLKEKGAELKPGKPLDMGRAYMAQTAIRDMLAEKGLLDSTVRVELRRVTETTRAVHFHIEPGGKTRIRKIEFTGNQLHSDRKLRRQLRLTQERKWYWPWSQKNLYHPVKWDQDVVAVRELYLNGGHLDVEVGAPIVEVRRRAKAAPAPPATVAAPEAEQGEGQVTSPKAQRKARERAQKQQKKAKRAAGKRWVYLTVPVTEGPRYRLGRVSFTGNSVFPEAALRSQIPLTEGAVFNNSVVEAGIQRITRGYEDRGYLYSNVVRRLERHEEEHVADLQIVIDEDKPYYIGRIDFSGNSATQDRVLRRELALLEGQLFNRTLLDLSTRKINQLGYWQVTGQPVIEPIEGESRVRIRFDGTEQGRNEIQIGGGFSGLEGAFFNGVYSTRNLLGRGQILSATVQVGGRSNRYQLSFQEPWFLNRPYLFGVSLFRRDSDYGSSLRSTSSGGGVLLGRRLKRFSQFTVSYSYEDVSSTSFTTTVAGDPLTFRNETQISSLTPVYSYSTVNNPYRPSAGRALSVSFQFAGGPLGGDTSFLKPIANLTGYHRAFGRTLVGLHGEFGVVHEFGGGNPLGSSNIEGVPRFQRFWLGGDTLGPRVFETRTITPRRYVELDAAGNIIRVIGDPRHVSVADLLSSGGIPALIEVGGDRMYLLQSELVLPLNAQAELALFCDMGDALFEDTSFDLSTTRVSAGLELRFHLPIFPVPLRLIYGVPVRYLEGDRTSNFTFSIGRSF